MTHASTERARQDPRTRPEREERLDRAAEKVVEHARADAKPYLRESKVPGGGE